MIKYLLSILLLLSLTSQGEVFQNRFTTNSEPLANGSINGAPLTNVPITSVSNLTTTLTALTNYADTKMPVTNGVAYGQTLRSTNGTSFVGYFTNWTSVRDTVASQFFSMSNAYVFAQSGGSSALAFTTNRDGIFGMALMDITPNTATNMDGFIPGNGADIVVSGNIVSDQDLTALVINGTQLVITGLGDESSIGGTLDLAGTTRLSGLTANRVPYLDGSKNIAASDVTDTELGYLSGVTSSIQSQIGSKLDKTNGIAITSLTGTNSAGFTQRFRGNNTALHEVQFQFNGSTYWNNTVTSNDITWLDESLNEVLAITNGGNAGFYKNLSIGGNFLATSNSTINSNLNVGGTSRFTNASTFMTNVFVGGAITATNLTGDRLLVSDSSKRITNSTVTATEAGYLSGVTGGIQTNINRRIPDLNGFSTNQSLAGEITFLTDSVILMQGLTTERALFVNGDSVLTNSTATSSDLTNITGLTGKVQTNIDARIRTVAGTYTNSLTGQGTLSVQSNAFFTTVTVTNAQTNLSTLKVAGQLTTTNPALFQVSLTNSTLAGITTNAGALSILQTNLTGIAAGNNNIAPGDVVTVSVTGAPGAAWNLNSIQGGRNGRFHLIKNLTGQSMSLIDESGFAVSPQDRLDTPGGHTITLPNGSMVIASYDTNISRWTMGILAGTNVITGVAANNGTATNLTLYQAILLATGATLELTDAGGDTVAILDADRRLSEATMTTTQLEFLRTNWCAYTTNQFLSLTGGGSGSFNPSQFNTNSLSQVTIKAGATFTNSVFTNVVSLQGGMVHRISNDITNNYVTTTNDYALVFDPETPNANLTVTLTNAHFEGQCLKLSIWGDAGANRTVTVTNTIGNFRYYNAAEVPSLTFGSAGGFIWAEMFKRGTNWIITGFSQVAP